MARARMAIVVGSLSVLLTGCAGPDASDENEQVEEHLEPVPPQYLPCFLAGLAWFHWFETRHPDWYFTSPRSEIDPRPWGGGFDPRTDPIAAHNEIVIDGVTPREVLALLRTGRSDRVYENSGPAVDCYTREPVTLALGRSYCWTTFGTEQRMRVVELEERDDEAVLAWQGGSLGVEVYHRWMFRATPGGTKVVTEELERGFLPNLPLYRDPMNPSLRAGHELWLRGLRAALTAR